MFEFIFLFIAFLILLIDVFILQTLFISFIAIWMISSSIVYFLLSFVPLTFNLHFGISLVLGVIPAYLYYQTIKSKYGGKVVTEVSFDEKKLFGLRSDRAKVKRKIDDNRYLVDVDGLEWTAISEESLNEGEIVKIYDIDGAILKVRK